MYAQRAKLGMVTRRPGVAVTLPGAGPVTRARNMALALALGSLVVAATAVNAGFWAAVVRAEAVAEGLSLPVIASLLLTGAAFITAAVLHWVKVVLQKP